VVQDLLSHGVVTTVFFPLVEVPCLGCGVMFVDRDVRSSDMLHMQCYIP
jgi:hypothetical protein